MRKHLWVLAVLLCCGLAACGDDDTGGGTDAGGGGGNDAGGGGGTDAGGGGGTDAGGGGDAGGGDDDSGAPAGACINSADTTYLSANSDAVSSAAASCGQGCALDADAEGCTAECLAMEHADLSMACRGCYVGTVVCAINNCVGACLGKPADDPGCVACRCGDNTAMEDCIGGFTDCSGIPSDDCDGT